MADYPSDKNFEEKGAKITAVSGGDAPAQKGFDPRNEHPEYRRLKEAWMETRDVYEGAEALMQRCKQYVPQRKMGESDEAYEERLRMLHFDGSLGALVDMMVGLQARKPPELDDWGLLGDPEQSDTKARKLVQDADRQGTSWENLRRQRATDLIVYRWYVSYVDTNNTESNVPRTPQGEVTKEAARQAGLRPYVNKATALDLLDWIEKDGRLIEAVVCEGQEMRDSLDDGKGQAKKTYLRFKLEGWERWIVDKDEQTKKDKPRKIGSGSYTYVDDMGKRRLPVVRRKLPSPRYAAYTLAKVVLAQINTDSHLDTLLRASALGQYLAIQGGEEEVKGAVSLGDKIITYPMGGQSPAFVAYHTDAAQPLESRIEALTARFWRFAQYEFTDRAREMTATEVDQAFASGIGSFLTLLAGVCEEVENEEKWLLAQAVQPPTGEVAWNGGAGQTKFARDFKVEDVIAELKRLAELLYGAGAPIPMSDELSVKVGTHILERLNEHSGILGEEKDIDVEAELRAKAEEDRLEKERMVGRLAEANSEPGFPEEEAA